MGIIRIARQTARVRLAAARPTARRLEGYFDVGQIPNRTNPPDGPMSPIDSLSLAGTNREHT